MTIDNLVMSERYNGVIKISQKYRKTGVEIVKNRSDENH